MDRLVCGREEDLVGFLYAELDEAEARAFRIHLKECASCSAELASFGNIRQSVIEWRDESLSSMAPATNLAFAGQRRSASAAVREFFRLSPVWMKAAVGFASLLFCIFAVLAVSGLRRAAPVVAVDQITPSAEEIHALIEKRVKDQVDLIKAGQPAAPPAMSEPPASNASLPARQKRPLHASAKNARRPLTRVEREQLAADLRLIAGTNEMELELLDDEINQ